MMKLEATCMKHQPFMSTYSKNQRIKTILATTLKQKRIERIKKNLTTSLGLRKKKPPIERNSWLACMVAHLQPDNMQFLRTSQRTTKRSVMNGRSYTDIRLYRNPKTKLDWPKKSSKDIEERW